MREIRPPGSVRGVPGNWHSYRDNKELRDPEEARRTITKIIVIITIAVSIEGLVYIFKAGTKDITLLLYPALLIVVSAILIVALGVY